MKRIIFVLGGARSGKSAFAAELAKSLKSKVAFIATCMPKDDEMRRRVATHKESRPASWRVIAEEIDLLASIKVASGYQTIIVDCLTLWVSNLLSRGKGEREITAAIRKILIGAGRMDKTLIVVSNEVGQGIVPENALARQFRDICGKVNQITASHSDDVYFVTAGIPVNLKKCNSSETSSLRAPLEIRFLTGRGATAVARRSRSKPAASQSDSSLCSEQAAQSQDRGIASRLLRLPPSVARLALARNDDEAFPIQK